MTHNKWLQSDAANSFFRFSVLIAKEQLLVTHLPRR
jgi:hypothetical protein